MNGNALYAGVVVVGMSLTARAAEPATSYSFDFGPGPAAAGHIKVDPDLAWSNESGFGFDLGTKPTRTDWGVTGFFPLVCRRAITA